MDVRPMHPFHRSELLVGAEGWDRLVASSACIIGLGGVGSYAAAALVRSVNILTGTSRVAGCILSRRHTWNPSMVGSLTSNTTNDGGEVTAARIASGPS